MEADLGATVRARLERAARDAEKNGTVRAIRNPYAAHQARMDEALARSKRDPAYVERLSRSERRALGMWAAHRAGQAGQDADDPLDAA